MRGTNIGEFEEIILLAVAALSPNAYGFAIMEQLENATHRNLSLTSLHASFNRLQVKGFLTSRFGEPTKVRGGKRKKFFELTPDGVEAIKKAREIRSGFWDNISLATLTSKS